MNKSYTPEQIKQAVDLIKEGSLSLREVGELVGAPSATVAYWAVKHGLSKRKGRSSHNAPVLELHDIDAELEATKAKLAELTARRERLSIRFESEREDHTTMVSVWGIIENAPVKAPLAAWYRFLNNDGVVRLRSFLESLNHSHIKSKE